MIFSIHGRKLSIADEAVTHHFMASALRRRDLDDLTRQRKPLILRRRLASTEKWLLGDLVVAIHPADFFDQVIFYRDVLGSSERRYADIEAIVGLANIELQGFQGAGYLSVSDGDTEFHRQARSSECHMLVLVSPVRRILHWPGSSSIRAFAAQ